MHLRRIRIPTPFATAAQRRIKPSDLAQVSQCNQTFIVGLKINIDRVLQTRKVKAKTHGLPFASFTGFTANFHKPTVAGRQQMQILNLARGIDFVNRKRISSDKRLCLVKQRFNLCLQPKRNRCQPRRNQEACRGFLQFRNR